LTEPRLLDVLVVSGGGFQGLGIVKCLRDSDRIRVVVADIHEDNVTRYFAEAFHRVPPVRETEAFIAALRDICAREGVRLVIPATAFELLALAEHEPALRGDGVRVAVSSAAFVRLAGDKSALYPFLAAKFERREPRLPLQVPRGNLIHGDPGLDVFAVGLLWMDPRQICGARTAMIARPVSVSSSTVGCEAAQYQNVISVGRERASDTRQLADRR